MTGEVILRVVAEDPEDVGALIERLLSVPGIVSIEQNPCLTYVDPANDEYVVTAFPDMAAVARRSSGAGSDRFGPPTRLVREE